MTIFWQTQAAGMSHAPCRPPSGTWTLSVTTQKPAGRTCSGSQKACDRILHRSLLENPNKDMVRSKILAQNYKTDQEIEIKEAIIGLLSVWLKSNSNASRFCTELFSAIWQKIRKFSIWPACLKKIHQNKTNWMIWNRDGKQHPEAQIGGFVRYCALHTK